MSLSVRAVVCVIVLSVASAAASAVSLQPTGRVRGHVVNDAGEPVASARVWLLELGESVRTLEDGSFAFEDVSPGTYSVLVETDLEAIATGSVTVEASEPAEPAEVAELTLVVRQDALRINEVVSVTSRVSDLIQIADSASEGVAGQEDLANRPILRAGDVLETVPGMVATQHSGGGKANQYFVRGFNLDHGTDFRITLDGVPVNMPSHGHGQGYADLNFLIPELVEKVSYRKGPYYAQEGDFSAAGAARFELFDRLDAPIVRISGGEFNYARALAAGSTRAGGGDLLGAVGYARDDGPWERPDDFKKLNAVLRYTKRSDSGGFRLSAQGYKGDWSSTDQIPQRAVSSGELSRFGFVDPSDAGSSSRYTVWGEYWSTGGTSLTTLRAYAFDYDMSLFSNFTYALSDLENGDQFEQRDHRNVVGVALSHQWLDTWGESSVENLVGLDLRHDWIDNGLYSTREQVRFATTREDSIAQLGGAPFFETRARWNDWVRTVAGIRADFFHADVSSDTPQNSGRRTDLLVSPKFSAVFGPWSRTELYANFGGGFHSNDARGATITIDPVSGEAVERVDPLVRAWGFDVGFRTEAANGFHTGVTFFRLDLDSELLFVGDGGTTEASRPSRRDGIEWVSTYEPDPWLKLELDVALTRGRFHDDDPADRIPGAMEAVVATGVTVNGWRGWSGGLRWRYFGPKPLIEDDSVRSDSSSFVTARVAYELPRAVQIGVEVFNLFDQVANDIDYFYESRLPGEPAGVADVHFHPLPSRNVRVFVDWRP